MRILRALIFMALVVAPFPAWGDYPERPVRLIVPFAPGGVSDTVARMVNQKIAERTGKQLLIDSVLIPAPIGTSVLVPQSYGLGFSGTSKTAFINAGLPSRRFCYHLLSRVVTVKRLVK